MIFEKPGTGIKITFDFVGIIIVVIVLTASLTYGFCIITEIIKAPTDEVNVILLDIVKAVAQTCTALTFIFGLHQYRKTRIQQRQLSISSEAKLQVDKMIAAIETLETGDVTSIKNINKVLPVLSNLGTNFEQLFNAMEEDIQKAIVRMQWQDMYFNYLRPALYDLDIVCILKSETKIPDFKLAEAIKTAEELSKNQRALKKYQFVKALLNNKEIRAGYDIKSKIKSLDLFTVYYLDDKELNDLLFGLMSRIDIRAIAPVLAVARE
ncbi:hypothetical protein [Pseudoalteromonas sp. SR44-2]|uniref:hypothetical protein n=1 Tax=Pseudoalteromonas sp. SR44-2 TaxID=2760937 RepID=UPI001601A5C2|nr:hypothetical protein [Pseudoalteromonas sp. SR44-2]MBB1338202.1 hypothetical protein [Pseudoalteromonas sp. SR44-2]